MDVDKQCQVCKKRGDVLSCSGCSKVYYCSREHQKSDWKVHRNSCKAFNIIPADEPYSSMSTTGSYAVAARFIKEGSLILEESPIFAKYLGPSHHCATCGNGVANDTFFAEWVKGRMPPLTKCTTCDLVVCNEECRLSPIHAQECLILASKKLRFKHTEPWNSQMVQCVNLIRQFVLKKKFESDLGIMKDMVEMFSWLQIKPSPLKVTIPPKLQLLCRVALDVPEADDDWYENMEKLCRVHGFFSQLDIQENDDIWYRLRRYLYLYKTSSHFLHSCSPNVDWIVGPFPDFKIRIRAAVDIKKGEPLFLNKFIYNETRDESYLAGTAVRQQLFYDRFGFLCQCVLCKDPTELNTYQSAIACTASSCKKNKKYFLPYIKPGNKDPTEFWMKCEGCGDVKNYNVFKPGLDEILNKLKEWTKENVGQLCMLLEFGKCLKNGVYHPKHWIIQRLMREWFLMLEITGSEYDHDSSGYMSHVLHVVHAIFPGMNCYRILMMQKYCDRLMHELKDKRLKAPKNTDCEEANDIKLKASLEMIRNLDVCEDFLLTAQEYFQGSPAKRDGEKLHHLEQAEKALKEVKSRLESVKVNHTTSLLKKLKFAGRN